MKRRTIVSLRVAALSVALATWSALATLAFGGKPPAQEATKLASPAVSVLPRDEIKEWTLPNGMRVVFLPFRRAPVVTVQVWYHAGSKDEPRDRRGSAHMFEHMMFKGTKFVPPEEHARLLDRIGGSVNAFTTEDMTAYHNTIPRQYLDFAVKLEAERMRHLIFRRKMIDTEREVVKEEIRQIENNPIAMAFRRFRELAFQKHPYAWDAGGRIEDLDATTPEDLKRFYDTYYVPNNATLIVVGDVGEDEVRASAEKWFAPIPRGKEPPRPADPAMEPPQKELRRETAKPAQLGVIIGGYKIPPARHDDQYVIDVIASILSDGESSRLNQRIVRKERIGVAAGAFPMQLEHPGLFLVFGVHLAPEQGERVEKALLDEIERLRVEPVATRELEKAKNQLASQLVFSLEDVNGLATQIGTSIIHHGDPRAWLDAYDKYLAVTAADVQRVARKYLVPEGMTIVAIPPARVEGGGK